MRGLAGAAMLMVLAASAPAGAQEASNRYPACRTAEPNGRIADVCGVVDEIYERLGGRDSSRHPRRYGELQNALAMALLVIGDTGDEAALRDCIAAGRAAAEYYSRARTPTRWAAIQIHIAGAMIGLAEAGDEGALQESVPTLLAAIEAIERAVQPALWAGAHSTLASAYIVQSRNGEDREALQAAIGALQSALEIYHRPVFAEERARTEARLTELLRALSEEHNES